MQARFHLGVGVVLAQLLRGDLAVFEDRVLHHLFADQVDELHSRQLQQLDRLLQLRGHHELLAELVDLLDLDRH